ncbi:carboxypeptidase regulatory-like domain-containing protein [Occallatibacter riparius]|uniref:Carboxypeptidase regulatory-like domain-containing protein n=1 Tax=Occallatibacter riparius TaxID=1002689 RepID=A0A9J7BRC6_9BACT|nr:carboxypeptidase regulatory-like domain-containing protein [Occallatibacter riparius]UWZ85387.1 carboxypeptidase regulatory-like domain-containing protein [Occallatibacter riparius]
MLFTEQVFKKPSVGPMGKRCVVWMWVLLFTLVGPSVQLLRAQANSGLTGSVTDPSGAAIPGATITFLNTATGISSQVASSSVGLYSVALAPGSYNVSVESPGFRRYQATQVLVEVGATPTFNIKMNMGAETQTVQVSEGNSIELNTTEPQLDTMLPPAEVSALPLEISGNIRQITSFGTLSPGVRSGPYGTLTVEGGNPKQINSSGSYYNGLPLVTASAINSDPPFEMVDEFRMLRSAFSSRYGMTQGAVAYNMRSGTNKLHGDVFAINRNNAFDSAGFFPSKFDANGKPVAPIDREINWGGSVGGPVVLPHLYNGHNRTFFLGSVDIFSQNQGITSIGTVPTPAMKNGDFSQFVDASGKLIPIYDPQTGQQFSCNGQLNVICPNRIDPLSQSLLQYLPDPDTPGNNFGLVANKLPAIQSVPFKTQAWGLTVNHALSSTQNLGFTWWRNHYSVVQESTPPIVPKSNPLTGEQSGIDNTNVWLGTYQKTVTPNLLFTIGLAAEDKMQDYVGDNQNVSFPGVTNGKTLPIITFSGQNAPTGWGDVWSGLINYYVDNFGWNIVNNWMWTRGRHTLNMGGEYHHYMAHTISDYGSGEFDFHQSTTSVPNSADPNFGKYGSGFASFLLGLPDSASRTAKTETQFYTQDYSPYIQDDIKLTSKLTVSAGLRWDVMVPYKLTQNNNVWLNPTAPNPAAGNLPGAATAFGNCTGCSGVDRAAIHWKNFGPHVGFAYAFDPRTVVHAGYIINFLGFNSAYGQGEGVGGAVSLASLLGGSFTVNGTGSNVPGYGPWTANGTPNPLPTVSTTPFSPSLGVAQTINYFNPNQDGRAPMYQAWNASVQRQLGWNTLITVAYSANRVTHLTGYNINPISQPDPSVLQYGSLLTDNINSPQAQAAGFSAPYADFSSQFKGGATVFQSLKNFPQYSNVARAFDQAGTTYYNALQIQADKHTGNGLTFLASLTLPRQYDNLATPLNRYNPSPEFVITSDTWESKIATTYQLPIGKGQRFLNQGQLGRWIGGWEVAGILTYNNGGTVQISQSGQGLNGLNRPNVVPGVKRWSGNWDKVKPYFEGKGPLTPVFSNDAFANTGSQFVLGNSKRAYDSIRGPHYPGENLSLRKLFRITEGTSLSLRMDYFNAFNRTQIAWPQGTNINASNFGYINSKFTAANRQGQIQAMFNF